MARSRVVHTGDLPWEQESAGAFFAHRRRRLARAAGGDTLGCTMFELEPGKTALPFHYHRANEEALYVLDGHGTLRLGDARMAVRAGDYVAFGTGPEDAHQLTNTGAEPLRYLMLSTRRQPDLVVYPDSDKVGVIDADDATFFPDRAAVDRWAGEPIGEAAAEQTPGRDPTEKTRAAEAAAQNAEVEREIDEEIERMKRRLASEPKQKPASAPRSAASEPDDDLDALKRKLEED